MGIIGGFILFIIGIHFYDRLIKEYHEDDSDIF